MNKKKMQKNWTGPIMDTLLDVDDGENLETILFTTRFEERLDVRDKYVQVFQNWEKDCAIFKKEYAELASEISQEVDSTTKLKNITTKVKNTTTKVKDITTKVKNTIIKVKNTIIKLKNTSRE